jgi:hypothetical protein
MASRRTLILGSLAAVAVLLVGAGAVMAQSGDDTPGSSFLDRVADKLGIQSSDLEQAIRDTRNEDIDAAVERGDLTQEQADRLKDKLDNFDWEVPFPPGGPGPFGPWDGGPGFHHGPRGPHGGFAFGFGLGFPEGLSSLADLLGIPEDQLRDELAAEGATLASVAEAHGKSRDELKAFLTDNLDEKLAQAVDSGKLTQETADDIRARMAEALDKIIDSTAPFMGRGHFKFDFDFRAPRDGEDGDATPEPSTPDAQSGSQSGVRRS